MYLISQLEDERERAKDVAFMEHVEDHLDEFDEEFLKEYRKKRIESLRKAVENEYVKTIYLFSDLTWYEN